MSSYDKELNDELQVDKLLKGSEPAPTPKPRVKRTPEERAERKRQMAREWREKNKDKIQAYKEVIKARKEAKYKELERLAAEGNQKAIEAKEQIDAKRRVKLDGIAARAKAREQAKRYYEQHKEEVRQKKLQQYHAKRAGIPKLKTGPKPKKVDVDYLATMNTVEIKLNESTNVLPGGALPSGDDDNDLIFEEIADKLGNL